MSSPSLSLVIGASKGLGAALVDHLSNTLSRPVLATVRSEPKEGQFPNGVKVIPDIDVSQEDCGEKLVAGVEHQAAGSKIDQVYLVAGILTPEQPLKPDWKAQLDMYKICTIGPLFCLTALASSGLLAADAKIIFLTSEAGSLKIRTESEGGGMYGHHGSKAAANMMGRLLSFDLKDHGVTVAMIHPGFLKTEMTKGAGFEDAYESGGAITPEEACPGIVSFADKLQIKDTGKFWAPNGPKGIGGLEETCGKELAQQEGPIELPW